MFFGKHENGCGVGLGGWRRENICTFAVAVVAAVLMGAGGERVWGDTMVECCLILITNHCMF